MKKTTKIEPRICPNCGAVYSAPSAISRKDDRTPICPECGIREALESIGCSLESQEHILDVIRTYSDPGRCSSDD